MFQASFVSRKLATYIYVRSKKMEIIKPNKTVEEARKKL